MQNCAYPIPVQPSNFHMCLISLLENSFHIFIPIKIHCSGLRAHDNEWKMHNFTSIEFSEIPVNR